VRQTHPSSVQRCERSSETVTSVAPGGSQITLFQGRAERDSE
jgi:hypothetical protein